MYQDDNGGIEIIDTKELRRLTQAATQHVGRACNYQDAHSPREGHVDFENADLFIASERPEEDAAFYAAANPAAISEILDRLEAAEGELETERMRLAACGVAALGYFEGCAKEYMSASLDDVLALRKHLEAAEKERDWHAERCEDVMNECATLRSKIERMERQKPIGEIQRANSTGNYICSEVWVPLPVGSKLYALPGAQGEEK